MTAASNAISLGAQATALFGTRTANSLTIDANLGLGIVSKGSANIWTTSKKIACSAFLADPAATPPTSMTTLTIVAKGKQKGD